MSSRFIFWMKFRKLSGIDIKLFHEFCVESSSLYFVWKISPIS